VIADVLAGMSVRAAGQKHGVSTARAGEWAQQARGLVASEPKKAQELGELVTTYLTEILATLSVQVRAFRDETWLRQQNAADAAVLHGVLVDKAVRLLAAAEQRDELGVIDIP